MKIHSQKFIHDLPLPLGALIFKQSRPSPASPVRATFCGAVTKLSAATVLSVTTSREHEGAFFTALSFSAAFTCPVTVVSTCYHVGRDKIKIEHLKCFMN